MKNITYLESVAVTGGLCACNCIDCDPGMDNSPRYFATVNDDDACRDLCDSSGRQYTYGSCDQYNFLIEPKLES